MLWQKCSQGTILKCFTCVSCYSRIPVVSALGLYWSLLHQENGGDDQCSLFYLDVFPKNPLVPGQSVINCMLNVYMLRAVLQPLDGFKDSQPVSKLCYSLYRLNMRYEILHPGCSCFAASLILNLEATRYPFQMTWPTVQTIGTLGWPVLK